MTNHIPVEIVRPKKSASDWISMVLADLLCVIPGTSAVVMLLLGACHHELDPRIPAFGYLQTLLALYTLRLVVNFATPWDSYKFWTKEARRGKH